MDVLPLMLIAVTVAFGATTPPPPFTDPQGNQVSTLANTGTILTTNTNPPLRQVGANYFEPLKESQVWMNFEPQATEVGPNPVLLNITIRFPGRRLERQPDVVVVRAQTRCFPQVFPQRVREPVLRFFVDSTTVDLTADKSYQFVPSCSKSSPDTVIVQAPFAFLRGLALSTEVTVQALGFSLRLTREDLTALRLFVDTIKDGITVR